MKPPKIVIGRSEHVDLPEWGIRGVRAKVDTGARSSALHVEHVEEIAGGWVRFAVVRRRGQKRRQRVATRILRRGRVRSSSGHYQTRIFVRTIVRIGPVEREVELSLVDRKSMLYRMLLGRTLLEGRFVVDVSATNLLGPKPERRRRRAQASVRGS